MSMPPEESEVDVNEDVWPFPSEKFLHEWAPGVLQAQNAWMSSIQPIVGHWYGCFVKAIL